MINSIFFTLLLLTACQSAPPEEQTQEKKPIIAEVQLFEMEELYETMTFAGTVEAKQETHVYAPLGGTIEQHFLEPGVSVKEGEPILSLRPDSLGLDFRINVIKATVSGTLIDIERDPTEHVRANEEIATIADLSQLIVDIHASQNDLSFLQLGEELVVVVAGEKTTGKILRVAQRAERKSRTFPVRLALPEHPSIRLGSFVKVIAKKNLRLGLRVPLNYLQRNQTALIVLDEDNKAHWVEVKVGQVFGDKVEILEGIDESSRVIGNFSRQPEEDEEVQISEDK
jgi:multidrug efflux pump subunit AcrA (membrane-fusion protein)